MFSDVFVLFHFNHKDSALPVLWIMTWGSTKSADTDIDNSISHSHQIEELGFDLLPKPWWYHSSIQKKRSWRKKGKQVLRS